MDGLTPPSSDLPDREARERIVTDLDTDILVEAGAGSGKTRALVERMVALVAQKGVRVDRIAAVTFTRKAASELRERFQTRLETELARTESSPEVRSRLDRALREIDRAFVGTIHAFCARLLRERPLDAGLDPAFRETLEDEERRRSRMFWDLHLERLAAEGAPILTDLDRVGLRPSDLYGLYEQLQANPDVNFEVERVPPPDPADVGRVREEVDRLLDRAEELMPTTAPEKGWGPVQRRLRRVLFLRRVLDWGTERDFFDALTELVGKRYSCTYNRWSDDGSRTERVKSLEAAAERIFADGGPAHALLQRWWAHRYPVAVRFGREAAQAYAHHRRTAGYLNFGDLLLLTADLLRRSARSRRELGERYRYLLVDEFQDTDPVQAEVVFLLASPPEQGDRWREVLPRPGQLFVVGDPKQSIYRFRRADMGVYEAVRRRFGAFGEVVELHANFRSVPAIGELVDGVFRTPERFPADPTPYQASFAPLIPRREDRPRRGHGIFWYGVEPSGRSKDGVALDDARRLSAWIRERVRGRSADRVPGDFLVLIRERKRLPIYVRELEARGLPVEVSGATVSAEEELADLMTLLRALVDPDDPVAVTAALTGVFFGLEAPTLLAHREAGGFFDFRMPVRPGGDHEGDPAVRAALGRMARWWERSRAEPADVVVGAMVEELGLVPWAAAGELGSLRAGAVLYGLDAVRAAALDGDATLLGALEALEVALDAREAEASLEPGRSDAVRVMNLHRAKGLEADVVVLAGPFAPWDPDPDMHVDRGEDGENRGWLVVSERRGPYRTVPLARPVDWPRREQEEARHDEAEEVRLLYVAVTRARDELIVARWRDRDAASPWSALHEWLDENAEELELSATPPPPRESLDVPGDRMRRREEEVRAERAGRARPGYRFVTVTERTKGTAREEPPEEGRRPPPQIDLFAGVAGDPDERNRAPDGPSLHAGRDWGSAVHATLEAVARGAEGKVLRSVARAHLLEYERPVDARGEPVELSRLLETVEGVRRTDVWRRSGAASRRLAEVPFALPVEDDEVETYLDGQVDLAFLEDDGWVLVDWKTDVSPTSSTVAAYRRQIRAYGEAWEALTGEAVKERLVLFTRTGKTERG